MASSIQLLRSTNPQERPFAGNLLEGQPAANLHSSEPGLFFKTTDGSVVKFGPAAITSDGSPPNSSPQGASGNSVGELWLDKSVDPAVLKVYDGSGWVDAGSGGGGGGGAGSFVRWIYTAIGGETSLSGTSGGVLLDYTPGLEEVYVNGVLITRGTDYSAINGTSITNLAPLAAGDVITVLSMNPLQTVQLPGQVTLLRWTILAAAGQTVLSGIDSSSQQLAYTAGFEEVYVNGAFLRRGNDYTATDGSTITISSPLTEDDEVTVMAWTTFTIGNQIADADVASNAGISSSKLNFLQFGLNAQSRTVQSKLREAVSVKDFGAIGDGISDDTAAVQAALSSGSTTVIVPDGVYLCGTLNSSAADLNLVGSGTLKLKSGVNNHLFLTTNQSANIRVEGVTFDGNQSQQSQWVATVFFNGVNTLSIDSCRFINGCGASLRVFGVYTKMSVTNCFFSGGKEHGGSLNQNSTYISVRGGLNTFDWDQFVYVSNCTFIGITPSVVGRGVGGIIVTSNSTITSDRGIKCIIRDNFFKDCGSTEATNRVAAIALYRAAPYTLISGNRIFGGDEKAIDIQGSDYVTVDSNYISNIASVGITFAARDSNLDCSRNIVSNNSIKSCGGGIYCEGLQVTPTSRDIIVSSNVVENCGQNLLVTDWRGGIVVSNNIFKDSTSTATGADDQSVAILGSRTGIVGSTYDLLFTANQIVGNGNSMLVRDTSGSITITGNSFRENVNNTALRVETISGSLVVTGNSFCETKRFMSVTSGLTNSSITCSGNSFANSLGEIRGVSFSNFDPSSSILCNSNRFSQVINDIVEFSGCLGRNLLSGNLGPSGSTVRVVGGSSVTQSNNLF